jgi:hypothetical protein
MKRILFILIALLGSAAVVSAQVYEYYFENRDAFRAFPQLKPVNESLQVKSMPPFNVDSLLDKGLDKEKNRLQLPPDYRRI